jgi:hypothetical protein
MYINIEFTIHDGMNYKHLTFGVLVAILVLGITSIVGITEAKIKIDKPHYTVGDTKFKGKVIIGNQCWILGYLRGTPKAGENREVNHILLNYQYFHNTKPSASTKDTTINYELKFKIIKIVQSAEGKARIYFEAGLNEESEVKDTLYVDVSQSQIGQTITVKDLKVEPDITLCQA